MDNYFVLEISTDATSQISESLKFLANVSTDAANNLLEEIKTKLNLIRISPHSYPLLTDPVIRGIEYRKAILSNGRYAIIYSINEEKNMG